MTDKIPNELLAALSQAIAETLEDTNSELEFTLSLIDMGPPVRVKFASSIPRDIVLQLWKGEIEGNAKVSPLPLGPIDDNAG